MIVFIVIQLLLYRLTTNSFYSIAPLLLNMDNFLLNIRDNSEWLYSIIFKYKWFYYDLWSFVYLWIGGIFFALLSAFSSKGKWLKLLLILSIFAFIENSISMKTLKLFESDRLLGIFNDIATGMIGGYFIYWFLKWKYTKKRSKWLALFISSITVSFLWVGFYGYRYSITFFNSPHINWWALTAWSGSGMIMIFFFFFLKDKINYLWGVIITWLTYISLLVAVEYIAYHLISLREVTEGTTPLIFDIIHGSRIMHVYYSTAPLYFIGLFILLRFLFKKSIDDSKDGALIKKVH